MFLGGAHHQHQTFQVACHLVDAWYECVSDDAVGELITMLSLHGPVFAVGLPQSLQYVYYEGQERDEDSDNAVHLSCRQPCNMRLPLSSPESNQWFCGHSNGQMLFFCGSNLVGLRFGMPQASNNARKNTVAKGASTYGIAGGGRWRIYCCPRLPLCCPCWSEEGRHPQRQGCCCHQLGGGRLLVTTTVERARVTEMRSRKAVL